ncbi:Long-chain-fatty-acid--CoA ligase FadD13 [Sinobacterium norvegicum]|uniref:Long-chain-fatty-acid--CoA ligase FadD13 n=1 Tax=Sinobacterium norvegicum TaxID=1641715 RepID=A0ABM9AG00_9GAMM|nr:class I adenylate-forming enzyme family protein [Sinobacterium norvegicum]CAH0992139.1 Long-chain-fatty-acid--CoA ligase FadD13 [Sinobacterium norvegicum]
MSDMTMTNSQQDDAVLSEQQLAALITKTQGAVDNLTAIGGAFEVQSRDVFGQANDVFTVAPNSLRDTYASCLGHGDKTFVVYHEQRLSFNQVYQQAVCLAEALASDYGIAKGDRVAIAMRNNPEWMVTFMAVTSLGAIAVPINSWWTTQELAFGLKDCAAKLVVVDNQRFDRIEPFIAELDSAIIVVDKKTTVDKVADYAEVAGRYIQCSMPTIDIQPDDDAVILYTSGSSGHPKGVVSTQRGILSAVISWMLLGQAATDAGIIALSTTPEEDSAALLSVPLFHVTGCHSLFLLSMIIGRKVVMMHRWDPEVALELIEREKISYVNGVPTMSQELLDAASNSNRDISSLVELASGGAARPPEHVRRIKQDFNLSPSSGYGLTETNALGAVNSGDTYISKPASVGMPSPGVTKVRIVDEQGEVLPTGEAGEICIQSPANARGYWNNPEATAESFKDGWFHSGDVGYIDELGLLYIVDRLKDIIIRGGENISCGEVEAAIYSHPAIAEVAVYAMPDERLGEIVAATIYFKQSFSLSKESLLEFLKTHLAAYKIPKILVISDEPLPRTGTDKIFKREIKQKMLDSYTG